MTYSQRLDQVPPDCENEQVPTFHDQITDIMYESEETIVEEVDLKPDEVAHKHKDNLELQT